MQLLFYPVPFRASELPLNIRAQNELSFLGCSAAAATAVDDDLAKMAAKGLSVIVSSGDAGSGYNGLTGVLWPAWPASSPWVTAVGGTKFAGQRGPTGDEAAADHFGSGGGFSSNFTRAPDAAWQEAAVSAFLAAPHPDASFPPASALASGGRATPDLSLLGEGYQVLMDGRVLSIDGTSAAAPAFAGMISLLNEVSTRAPWRVLA